MGYAGNQPQYGTFPSDLFTGNGSNTVFTMSSVPGNDAALLVTVDGVRQHTDTYSFTANTLTFSEAPGSGAIIETVNMGSRADIIITEGVYKKTQFTATASQTNFTIPTGYTVGFVDVYLNGIRLVVADDFTATDGSTVILATAAASGDSVEVVAYGTFNVANALLKSGDTMSGNLVVSGTSTLMSPVAIANTTGNTVVFAANGNLGVGTSAPTQRLQVESSSDLTIQLTKTGIASFLITNNGASGTELAVESVPMIFKTAGTERARIDSSGRITMPYQPVFSARIISSTDMTSSSDFVFTTPDVNIGSHYNSTTGRFTAPVTGSYFFHWEGLAINTEDDTVDVRFYKNGSQTQLATCYLESDMSSGYRKGWMTAIVALSAGDYLTVRTQSGTITFYGDNNPLISVSGSGHTQFKGYLIG